MISIPRSWARDLRAVFRRLSPNRKGLPLAVELTVERNVLAARCAAGEGAAEFRHSAEQIDAQLVVPLEALADCEGKDPSPVQIDTSTEKTVRLRWTHNGVPHVRTYGVPEWKSTFPQSPSEWTPNPLELFDALDEAVKTTAEDSTRYALGRVQFKGSTGEIIASDSKQLLIQGGFDLPWDDNVLVSRVGASAVRAIDRVESIHVGRTEGIVWLRTGPWSLALPIDTVGRYPDVMAIIPSSKSDSRLVLDPSDADVLAAVLPDLPGADVPFRPVTVELNGRVAVRAQAVGQAQATELRLERSRATGPALRFAIDRNHLTRLHQLGFDTVQVVAPSRPIVCRKGQRIYVAMPLGEKAAIAPADDVLRVAVPTQMPATRPKPQRRVATIARALETATLTKPQMAALNARPIEETREIQKDLRSVLKRVRELSAVIRRQHRVGKPTPAYLPNRQLIGA